MTITTPNAPNLDGLQGLASRYVTVADLPWQDTKWPGISIKVLMQDDDSGMMTSLTRFAPGASLPLHEHVGLEQSFVLEGALEDDEGVVTAGNYVWRPAGSRHVAHSREGCLVLGVFQKPNLFLDQKEDG